MVIFDGVKSVEMVDFVGVCRSGYRSKNGENVWEVGGVKNEWDV